VIEPVKLLMDKPVGRPEAVHAIVAPLWVSVAALVNVVMADPVTLDWLDLAVTATVLKMVHEKVAEPDEPAPSVAVIVTVETPGVVGLPLIAPVPLLIERPAGSPDWVQVSD